MTNTNPQSHYVGPAIVQDVVSRTLSVLVDNEPGVLARVIGLFTARGYNIDTSTEHFVFEVTGKASKIDTFINLMRELGLVEVSRTGIAAIGRGLHGM